MMSGAFGLGMSIQSGTLRIDSDNNFTASTRDGVRLEGKFTVLPGGRPKQCDFTSPTHKEMKVHVDYDYQGRDASNPIPTSFKMDAKLSSKEKIALRFQILDCRFGRQQVATNGFEPVSIIQNTHPEPLSLFSSPVVFSNGGIFHKLPNNVGYTIKNPNVFWTHKLAIWFVFLIPNCVLITWLIQRARRKQKQTTGTIEQL
jgi:hypothetical protein